MKKTKIIATVGPASGNDETLIALNKAGINVIRFNFSHAEYENVARLVSMIDNLNKTGKTNLSMLLDTKGPEIRTGDLTEKIQFNKDDEFLIYVDKSKITGDKSLFCDYEFLIDDMKIGDIIRIDSGLFDVVVIGKTPEAVKVKALNDALIGSRRHINLPGIRLRLPGITDKDKKDILFGIEQGMDFIAMSFVRNKENIQELRDFLSLNNASHIKIISKVENQESIENIDDIVKFSDGVMVARGDLGIEVPIEMLPIYQRSIVKKCREEGKFVIVATHLLETMIENPFPTRAEVSDIFNSVLQKADSLMLSGETAVGKYPVQTATLMSQVIEQAEKTVSYKHDRTSDSGLTQRDIEKKHLIRSAIFIGEELNAKAVVILTKSGLLARLAAAFRPNLPIFGFTMKEKSVKFMNQLFGIEPIFLEFEGSRIENSEKAIRYLYEAGKVGLEDKVIAITDICKNDKEIPVMEIVYVKDVI